METVVNAQLIVSACASLRPSCLNLVPFVMEAVCELLSRGDTQAAEALRAVKLVTYGGAAVAPHCVPLLREHGIAVLQTYGQTELGGPVLLSASDGHDGHGKDELEGAQTRMWDEYRMILV